MNKGSKGKGRFSMQLRYFMPCAMLLLSLLGKSQVIGYNYYYSDGSFYDFNYEPPIVDSSNAYRKEWRTNRHDFQFYGDYLSVYDSSGQVLFFSDGLNVINSNYKKQLSVYRVNEAIPLFKGFPISEDMMKSMAVFSVGTNRYKMYRLVQGWLVETAIELQDDGSIVDYQSPRLVFDTMQFGAISYRLNQVGKDWLFLRYNNLFYSFPFEKGELGEPIISGDGMIVPDSLPKIKPGSFKRYEGILTSRDGKSIITCIYTPFEKYTYPKEKSYGWAVVQYRFNNITGAISQPQYLFKIRNDTFPYPNDTYNDLRMWDMTISPNDSIIYVSTGSMSRKFPSIWQVQRSFDGDSVQARPIYLIHSKQNFELWPWPIFQAPNGKIYFAHRAKEPIRYNNNIAYNRLGIIENPDVFGDSLKISLNYRRMCTPNGAYIDVAQSPKTMHIGYLPRVKFKAKSNCRGSAVLFNLSDKEFISYEWYAGDKLLRTDKYLKPYKFDPVKPGRYYFRLKGTTDKGLVVWFSDTVIIQKKLNFSAHLSDSVNCAWNEFSIITDTLCFESTKNRHLEFNWNFGDGKHSKIQSPVHQYRKAGSYFISGYVTNGYDSVFISFDTIRIREAPKPGFIVEDSVVCLPDSVKITDSSKGDVLYHRFVWSDSFATEKKHFSRYFDSAQELKITQILTGPTGCTTRDSAYVRIRPGFTKNDSTALLYATVIDSERVQLKWLNRSEGAGYILSRSYNDSLFSQVNLSNPVQDTLVDTVPVSTNQIRYSYRIALIDSCGNISAASNPATTILLQAKNYNNEYVVLSWTAYEKWESGVKEYLIESSVDGKNWSFFQSAIQLAFTDKNLPYNNEALYYRIKAVEQNGYGQQSYSNVVKVALKSTLFIPNAFTPNGDGVNDIFSVGTWGITNFDCHIYSRWGQQVAHSTDASNIWDGTFNEEPFAMDNYRYVIDATTTEGKQLHFDGTLVLIR
ncbi:T9SS type B sorting domain-containing protein [bacterium]|nr:T9SS type B sorting domain-containing protein [bacterium]